MKNKNTQSINSDNDTTETKSTTIEYRDIKLNNIVFSFMKNDDSIISQELLSLMDKLSFIVGKKVTKIIFS